MNFALELALNEALAVHEAFRRLGFPADELFFAVYKDGLAVELRQGEREFVVRVAKPLGVDSALLTAAWTTKVEWWNTIATEEQRASIWQASQVANGGAVFVLGLAAKGFTFKEEGQP